MTPGGVIPQLRTTDLARSIRFYTAGLGFALAFRFEDFYAGIGTGSGLFHLKHADRPDPGLAAALAEGHFHLYFPVADAAATAATLAARGIALDAPPHDTAWGTREFSLRDDQGHVLYFGQTLPAAAGPDQPPAATGET